MVLDACLSAWCKATRFDPGKGDIVAWLLTITRHRAIDRLRHGVHRSPLQGAHRLAERRREFLGQTVVPKSQSAGAASAQSRHALAGRPTHRLACHAASKSRAVVIRRTQRPRDRSVPVPTAGVGQKLDAARMGDSEGRPRGSVRGHRRLPCTIQTSALHATHVRRAGSRLAIVGAATQCFAKVHRDHPQGVPSGRQPVAQGPSGRRVRGVGPSQGGRFGARRSGRHGVAGLRRRRLRSGDHRYFPPVRLRPGRAAGSIRPEPKDRSDRVEQLRHLRHEDLSADASSSTAGCVPCRRTARARHPCGVQVAAQVFWPWWSDTLAAGDGLRQVATQEGVCMTALVRPSGAASTWDFNGSQARCAAPGDARIRTG